MYIDGKDVPKRILHAMTAVDAFLLERGIAEVEERYWLSETEEIAEGSGCKLTTYLCHVPVDLPVEEASALTREWAGKSIGPGPTPIRLGELLVTFSPRRSR